MKKTKWLAIALLSAVACTTAAFGLTACSSGTNQGGAEQNSEIYSIYQTYVAYAQENGKSPLSYEDWLSSIKGEKGDKGDKGEDGKDGADGLTPYIGKNGNWWIGETDTSVKAQGAVGDKGDKGEDGKDGENGVGIQSVTVNEKGELVITDTNGNIIYQGKVPSCAHEYGEAVDIVSTCTSHWVVQTCSMSRSSAASSIGSMRLLNKKVNLPLTPTNL